MERRTRHILVGVVFGVTVAIVETASAGTHRAGSEPEILTVAIDDRAHVPGPLLKDAKERAANVFRMSNLDIVWVNADDARLLALSTPVTVIIAMTAPSMSAKATPAGTDVLGQAVPDVRRATSITTGFLESSPRRVTSSRFSVTS